MICENRLWKLTVQNSVRTANPEKRLAGFFKNSKPGRFLEPAPNPRTDSSHKKVRTAQHYILPPRN
jgi:hypothetical protein